MNYIWEILQLMNEVDYLLSVIYSFDALGDGGEDFVRDCVKNPGE